MRAWPTRPSLGSDDDGRRDEGEVAGPHGELRECGSAPAGGRGDDERRQQLVGLDRGRERPGKNDSAGDQPLAARRAHGHRGVEGERGERELGGGIRVREASSERAAHADRQVADAGGGLAQQAVRARELHALERRVPDERVDDDLPVAGPLLRERPGTAHVDEMRGAREPVGEHRQQALPACEHLGVLAALGEQVERLLRAVRARIREGRRLHDAGRAATSRPRRSAYSRCSGRGSTRARRGCAPRPPRAPRAAARRRARRSRACRTRTAGRARPGTRAARRAGVAVREALDRLDPRALGLRREHDARAHGRPVEEHGARAADAVLAAEMRARQAVLAQSVGERPARLRRRASPGRR